MRAAVPVAVFIVSLVAISVILASIASTFAVARPQVEGLDVDMASVIRADYSADPSGTRLAPLSGEITDAARKDKERQDRPKQQPPGQDKPKQEPPDQDKPKQEPPNQDKPKDKDKREP